MTMHPKKSVPAKQEAVESEKSAEEAKPESSVFPSVPHPCAIPLIGVKAIADRLCRTSMTAHRWKEEFADFPVRQEKFSGTWYSTEGEIDAWKAKHPDLFITHKERQAKAAEIRTRRIWS